MKNILIFFILSSVSFKAFCEGKVVITDGVKMELSIGMPNLTITNPDSTKASYTGLSSAVKGFIPFMSANTFRADLTGGIQYYDFNNTANGNQSEYAQYIGPGVGLEFSLSHIFFGGDILYLKGRHTAIGTFSHKSEFDISGMNMYAGYRVEFGTGAFGCVWSKMSTTIPGSAVNISGNSKWDEEAYWLQFSYNFKIKAGDFFSALFGK